MAFGRRRQKKMLRVIQMDLGTMNSVTGITLLSFLLFGYVEVDLVGSRG